MFRILLIIFCCLLGTFAFADSRPTLTLSLKEAVLLAVRANPNVQQAQLNHVIQKYSLDLAHWQFKPHYAFTAQHTTTSYYSVTDDGYVSENTTGATPSISWLSPIGTQMTLSSDQTKSDHYNPGVSLEIIQPLMRGFGRAIVEAELYNAMDSEKISRLAVESALRSTVTAVINAYLEVVLSEKNLEVDQKALERAEQSVQQTQLFIKAGHKAGVELVTVKADAASAKTRIELDQNNVNQARYSLLNAIGIDPNTNVHFTSIDVLALIKKYVTPPLALAIKKSLENDIQYQTDEITLTGATERSLLQAEDQTRWQLNMTADLSTGDGSGSGKNAGVNSLVNGVNQTNSLSFNLSIPLDDQPSKNAVATAKIAIRQSKIALQQEKWNKETVVINEWNSIYSSQRAVALSEQAEKLQQQSWNMSYQKYTYGLIDSLQLQSAQQQLISSQQALNSSQINYLKALVNFDQMLGDTLKTWNIQIRYGETEND